MLPLFSSQVSITREIRRVPGPSGSRAEDLEGWNPQNHHPVGFALALQASSGQMSVCLAEKHLLVGSSGSARSSGLPLSEGLVGEFLGNPNSFVLVGLGVASWSFMKIHILVSLGTRTWNSWHVSSRFSFVSLFATFGVGVPGPNQEIGHHALT